MHITDDNCKKAEVSDFKSIGPEHVYKMLIVIPCKFFRLQYNRLPETDNAKDRSFIFQGSNKLLLQL